MTSEAEQVAQIHVDLQQKMLNQVYNSVSTWKTSNYHKSILSWKETKNAEEGFSKAQKPWAKKYDGGIICICRGLTFQKPINCLTELTP